MHQVLELRIELGVSFRHPDKNPNNRTAAHDKFVEVTHGFKVTYCSTPAGLLPSRNDLDCLLPITALLTIRYPYT